MMRSRISENESLRKAFRDAYAAKEREETGDGWQSAVMKRVRRMGPLTPASNFLPAFEHFVWRLAPVSCLLVIALTLLLMNIDFGGGSDYLGTVTLEVEQPTLLELFGLDG